MTELMATGTAFRAVPQGGLTIVAIETPTTAAAADTVSVTLGSWGIKRLLGVTDFFHTTAESVIVPGESAAADATSVNKAVTTSVSSGIATLTIGSAGKHTLILYGVGQV